MAPDGSLVATGQALRGFLDWYTVGFDTTGVVRWEAVRDGGLNTDEIPAGVLVLPDGTSVVTGKGGPNLPGGFIPGVTAGYSLPAFCCGRRSRPWQLSGSPICLTVTWLRPADMMPTWRPFDPRERVRDDAHCRSRCFYRFDGTHLDSDSHGYGPGQRRGPGLGGDGEWNLEEWQRRGVHHDRERNLFGCAHHHGEERAVHGHGR